ncbi:MAG: hypothetical protein U0T77_03795 [Chitinophagales bacterium]
MNKKQSEYDIDEWKKLNDNERQNILNHIWDVFEPEIGRKTKLSIIEDFIAEKKIEGLQYGIRGFGWYVYMLYVIVNESKTRIPKKFLGLPVNKGVIIEKVNEENAIVKFYMEERLKLT